MSATAPWTATVFSEDPWNPNLVPTLTGLIGFNIQMLGVDLLHIFHLGVGRDLCGSVIKILASKRGYWRGGTQEQRLKTATRRLKWYAKNHKQSLALSKLSKQSTNWKSDQYPELRAKGFDCFVVLRWLCWEVNCKNIENDLLATVPS